MPYESDNEFVIDCNDGCSAICKDCNEVIPLTENVGAVHCCNNNHCYRIKDVLP